MATCMIKVSGIYIKIVYIVLLFYVGQSEVTGYSCGASIPLRYGSSITLQSPNYPSSYSNNIRCSWTINAPSGSMILVHFVAFYLESNFDYLHVAGHSSYSGAEVPNDFSTSTNSLNIRFTTDGSVTYSGFELRLTIVDTTPPQINGCPNNIQATTELGTSRKSVTWTEPTSTDLSGTPSRTRSHEPGATFTTGPTTVRYTFTDTSNNVATCTFTVTVETVDTTPPQISECPNNIQTTTELGTSRKSVTWTEPTSTDISGTPSRTRSHEPGATFTTGPTTVRYTFTDTSNNVATCTFTVTVETVDTTPPQISGCPNDIQTTTELGTSRKSVTWTEPTSTDLSRTPSRTRSHEPGATFTTGPTTVRYTFTDTSNNVATCTFTITVETVDTTPPQISECPNNIQTTTELGTSRKSVTWTEPTATDISGTPLRTRSHEPGATFTIGPTTVRYTFTDTSNNVATCTFTVTVETVDTTPPQISECPNDIQTTTELGTSTTSVTWTEPTATDLSGTPSRTRSHEPGATFTIGPTTVRYTFTDTSNNVATCTFTITVETVDTTPPRISGCPNDIQTTTELGTSTTSVTWTEPTATDLSGTPSRTRTHQPGARFNPGPTTVRYNFTDTSSNVATCTFIITVEIVDTTPPVINGCPGNKHTTTELGTSMKSVTWIEPTATDLSGTPSRTLLLYEAKICNCC
ncbi:hyalin-like [Amphiura filiformis]|uniref:hyalin-like n=1 Tax=Amphiura filiformis TaxID=82378 RepID=UPI003B21A298